MEDYKSKSNIPILWLPLKRPACFKKFPNVWLFLDKLINDIMTYISFQMPTR